MSFITSNVRVAMIRGVFVVTHELRTVAVVRTWDEAIEIAGEIAAMNPRREEFGIELPVPKGTRLQLRRHWDRPGRRSVVQCSVVASNDRAVLIRVELEDATTGEQWVKWSNLKLDVTT
jgi:hypothetical protein